MIRLNKRLISKHAINQEIQFILEQTVNEHRKNGSRELRV